MYIYIYLFIYLHPVSPPRRFAAFQLRFREFVRTVRINIHGI